jgi:hypothetical protein
LQEIPGSCHKRSPPSIRVDVRRYAAFGPKCPKSAASHPRGNQMASLIAYLHSGGPPPDVKMGSESMGGEHMGGQQMGGE